MDLDKEARKKTMPLFLDSKLDKIKLDDTIFNEVIKTNEDYTPFLKTISKKNKIAYYSYLILSNLMVSYYEKADLKPKRFT